jgi:hypothetical protein
MTTMTNPHDLLATVPFLIGYHPQNSLVFVALANESAGVAMRIDFPIEPDPEQISVLIQHLVRQKADEVFIAIYQPDDHESVDELMLLIQKMLHDAQMPIAELITVKAGRWRSVLCSDLSCCPADGTPLARSSTSELLAKMSEIPEIDYEGEFHQAQQQGHCGK